MQKNPDTSRRTWPYVAAIAVTNSLLWLLIGWGVTYIFPSIPFWIFLIVGPVAGLIVAIALYLFINAKTGKRGEDHL
ncbi:hypothetical protein [Telluribacter humicola]|uniref:hypothetical protein n=1 Tax=Telluribacter humicola TaxID=1720261 RepID=UPI001A961694|nr:hypothetical protein [Telluribacter humicola]